MGITLAETAVAQHVKLNGTRKPCVIVCGDSNWTDRKRIGQELQKLPPQSQVVHRTQVGCDHLISQEAKKLGLLCLPIGKSENSAARMITQGRPDMILVFRGEAEMSYETRDIVRWGRETNVPIRMVVFVPVASRPKKSKCIPSTCPACGSRTILEIQGHVSCDNCKIIIASCCEGGPSD